MLNALKRREYIESSIKLIINLLDLKYIDDERVFCISNSNSKSKSYARIFGLPYQFQLILNIKPVYVIEIIERNFNSLSKEEKIEVLIHEIAHIPFSFSGNLRPHNKSFRRYFDQLIRKAKNQEIYKYIKIIK